jgi:hypothetical protein
MNTLKEEKNRGYVIAGIGGIVAFIAFFLPYVSASGLGYGTSWSGSTMGGGLYFELLASLVAVAIALVLIYSKNVFGLTNMPPDKQVRYGIFTLVGAGAVGLLAELILAVNHNSINGIDLTVYALGLSIGWWLYLLSAIAIIVGGVMALRNPQTLAARSWQYPASQYPYSQTYSQPYPPQSAQYPPYSTTGQPQYPPYSPQYPADPEQFQATEPGQQYAPTELRPTPQTGPQNYPNTGPQSQPYPPSELPPPPPPPYSSPQQMPPA